MPWRLPSPQCQGLRLTGTADEKHAPPKRPRPGRRRHVLRGGVRVGLQPQPGLQPPGQKHRRGIGPGMEGRGGEGKAREGKVATRPARTRPARAAAPRPARARRNPLPAAGSSSGIPRSPPPAQTPAGRAGVHRPAPPPPRAPLSLNFYLHLRALVSPASLRRRPGAEREPEPPLPPPPPPAGGKRGEGDEHPGADSPAPRRHRNSPARRRGVAALRGRLARFPPSAEEKRGRRDGRWGRATAAAAAAAPSASHTRTSRCGLPLTHPPPPPHHTHPTRTEGGGTGTRPSSPFRGGCAQPINPAAPGVPAAVPPGGRRLSPARRQRPLAAVRPAGRPDALSQDSASRHTSPPPLPRPPPPRWRAWYVPFCCSRARWLAAGGDGNYHFRAQKGRGRRERITVPRALPGQPPFAARSAGSAARLAASE